LSDPSESELAGSAKSIFVAMHRAGEFFKLSRDIPPIVRERIDEAARQPGAPLHRDVPRALWLRRAFGEWLDRLCGYFAGHEDELCEQIDGLLEMAWYGQLANSERRAPGWLIGWPEEVEQDIILAAPERLDAAGTWNIEKSISARIKEPRTRDQGPDAHPQLTASIFSFTSGSRSLTFRNQSYTLTPQQAEVIDSLNDAYRSGKPDVGKDEILEKIGSPNSRLQDTFRNSGLWRTVIVPGKRRGTYRLNLPERPATPSEEHD
jgi:hypothetical protein